MTLRYPGDLAVAAGARASGALRRASHGAQAAWHVLGRARSAGWALADQCVVSAANFLTIFLFARFLETAVFGAFMLAYTGLLLLTNLQNALVMQPHNVLAAGLPRTEYRRFTAALAVLLVLCSAAVCLVLCGAGWLVAAVHSQAGGELLVALAVAAVPWTGQEFVRRVLYTRGESRAAAANDCLTYGLQVSGAVALLLMAPARATPVTALSVLGLSSLAGVLVGAWQLRHHVGFADDNWRKSCAGVWAEAWRFGRWLTAQNGLAWFGAQGHSWVVGLLLGVEQVGIYRAATHLVNVMNPLMQACFSYLPSRGSLAYLARGAAGLSQWVERTLRLLLIGLAPFLVALVVFPGQALELAYGDKYAGTELAWILALTAVAQCIGFSKYPFDLGLMALRSTRSIFYVYLIPVALLLTLGTALIHFLGILGVPLSVIAINSALLVATWLAYRGRMKRERAAASAENS